MKNVIKKFDVKKFRMAAIKMAITACTIAMAMGTTAMMAFAANDENATPSQVTNTGTMNTIISVVFWVIRIIILIAGGGPALIKIVQGQSDENPRDRNAGIIAAVVTGACFAASFAIEGLIKA